MSNENNSVSNGQSKHDSITNGSSSIITKIEAKVKKARSFVELTLLNTSNSVKTVGRNERRVLVLYTGGTIGMVKNRDGGKI